MIPLHLSLCILAALLAWRPARAVALALAVVVGGTIGHQFYPSLIWQFVGPLAVTWLCRMLWGMHPLEENLPPFGIALAVVARPAPSRLAWGLYVAAAHAGALLAGLRALQRRTGPVRHEERLAGILLASSAGGACGAMCWGLWGSVDVAAISDVVFLLAVIGAALPWRASASSR